MMTVPSTVNSITISAKTPGEFGSVCPVRLHGIINQDEYCQSIDNINRISNASWIFLLIFFFCFLLSIPIVCIVMYDWLMQLFPHSGKTLFAGLILILLAACRVIIKLNAKATYESRLKKVVAKESAKYSMRLPISCSWRLEINATDKSTMYSIIIDIHPNTTNHFGTNPRQTISNPPQQDSILHLASSDETEK